MSERASETPEMMSQVPRRVLETKYTAGAFAIMLRALVLIHSLVVLNGIVMNACSHWYGPPSQEVESAKY
jgi:hypothetical protein